MTLRAAARRHGAGINGVVKAWSAALAEHRRSRRCRVLLVDEPRCANGTARDRSSTATARPWRWSSTATRLRCHVSDATSHRWCKGVKVVADDIDAHLGHARHVLLPRHQMVLRAHRGAPDIQRRPEGSKPAFDPEVFRARFALLTRRTQTGPASTPSWTPTPASKPAGRPYRSSTASTSPTTTKAPSRRLRPLRDRRAAHHDIVDTIIAWSDEILAWHHTDRAYGRMKHKQPAPSAQAQRPRLHQPHQLRSPRHPRDIMTPTGAATLNPT